MTLNRFLAAPDWTERKLAKVCRRLGRTETGQSTINRLRNKTRKASLELAMTIEQATLGLVKAEQLPLSRRTRRALRRVRSLASAA